MTHRTFPTNLFFQVLRGYNENDRAFDEIDAANVSGFHEVSDEEKHCDSSTKRPSIDYRQLIDATQQVGNWLLAVARLHTNDPVDLAAIERVQTTIRANFEDVPPSASSQASEEDVLVVLGILITAFEIDFRLPGLGTFAGALYDATDGDLDSIKRHLLDLIAHRAGDQDSSCTRRTSAHGVTTKPPSSRRIPIVVQRGPRVAHGANDLARPSGTSVLIIR